MWVRENLKCSKSDILQFPFHCFSHNKYMNETHGSLLNFQHHGYRSNMIQEGTPPGPVAFSSRNTGSDRASVAEMLFSLPEAAVVVILRLTTKPETELTRPGGGFVSRLRFPGFNGHFGRKRRWRRANKSTFLTNAAALRRSRGGWRSLRRDKIAYR